MHPIHAVQGQGAGLQAIGLEMNKGSADNKRIRTLNPPNLQFTAFIHNKIEQKCT